MRPALPVTLICGFLGAGKTTLLNRLLADPMGRRLAVLVNDFGAINIDADLIVAADDSGIALSNGCICCSIRDDLALALLQLHQERPEIDHVLIEASGISDPVGIAEALFRPDMARHFRVDSIVAVVDAEAYPALDFHAGELVLRQAAVADLVLLNKCDIASAEALEHLRRDMADAAPRARLYPTRQAALPAAILFEPRDLSPAFSDVADCSGDHHHGHDHHGHDHHWQQHHSAHHHGQGRAVADELPHGFSSRAWHSRAALDLPAFTAFVRGLPKGIYRGKGILHFQQQPQHRAIFHLVGKRSSVEREQPWSKQPDSRLVLIGRATEDEWDLIDRAFALCAAAGDALQNASG